MLLICYYICYMNLCFLLFSFSNSGGTGTNQSSFTEISGKTQNKGHNPLHKRISDLSGEVSLGFLVVVFSVLFNLID